MNRRTNLLEQAFERALWASRLVMLIAVVGSVLLAFGSFYLAIIDMISVFAIFKDYADPSLGVQDYTKLRNDAVTTIVRVIDGFLIGAILLLFAFAVYDLFISKINPARRSESGQSLLAVGSLDDLKEKVARLVIVVLVIEFFQLALKLPYDQAQDLLYLAAGILFVSGAVYLTAPRRLEAPGSNEGSNHQDETQRDS